MKIAVIGYSGSGKSTLARKLGEKYGEEVLYLDTVHWLPGWEHRTLEEKCRITGEFLDTHGGWVIDGNYSRVLFERRMEEADRIFLLKFNRFACLYRVFRRYMQYRGKTRDSMTAGCEEKIDAEFLRWVFYKGRNRKTRHMYGDLQKRYSEKVRVIKNQRQLTRLEKDEGLPL